MISVESFIAVIVIPVTVGVLKVLFSEELRYLVALVISYFIRPFDTDKNGKTHDWCYLHSAASGNWSKVSLLYRFNPFNCTSGVYVHRYDMDGRCISVERIRYADWHKMRKAVIVNPDHVKECSV